MNALHVISTGVLLVLAVGFASRANHRRHRALMLTAFAADLGVVIWIEATRHAVEKVAGGVPPVVAVHAGISTAVLVFYVAMITLGSKVFAGRTELRAIHRNLGITFAALRGLNYLTSFLV